MKLLNTIVVLTLTNLALSGNVQAAETLFSKDNLQVVLADNIAANLSEIAPVAIKNTIAEQLSPVDATRDSQPLLAAKELQAAASETDKGVDAE